MSRNSANERVELPDSLCCGRFKKGKEELRGRFRVKRLVKVRR